MPTVEGALAFHFFASGFISLGVGFYFVTRGIDCLRGSRRRQS